MRISTSNSGGFTLIELMVAMLISIISVLALLKALEVATETNVRNLQREEAVQVAASVMTAFRSTPFDNISASYAPLLVQPKLRGVTNAPPYRVTKSSVILSPTSKLVDVRVRWLYKNMSTSHEVQSVVQE